MLYVPWKKLAGIVSTTIGCTDDTCATAPKGLTPADSVSHWVSSQPASLPFRVMSGNAGASLAHEAGVAVDVGAAGGGVGEEVAAGRDDDATTCDDEPHGALGRRRTSSAVSGRS